MDLRGQAKRVRNAVGRHGRAGRGNPYPDWLRREALEYAAQCRAAGSPQVQISRELGLSVLTLSRWQRSAPRLLPVVVEPALAAPDGIFVLGPGGLRIEGLSIESLAALLRALS